MKKIIKVLAFFLVLLLSLCFSSPAYAITKSTEYISIESSQNLKIGYLSFHNISFKDYSTTSTQAFGLTGWVENSSKEAINYKATVAYYDENYALLAQKDNIVTIEAGIRNFNQMANLNLLENHNSQEIAYYQLTISILEDNFEQSSETNLTPSTNSLYENYEYVIDKYDINIIVNENNTFDITETITAYFNIPKHGIFRTIPLKNTVTRLDGTVSNNRTQVTNVSVDNKYTSKIENGNLKLQIGDETKTLTGQQTYVIKYTYNLGKDPQKNYDELYYNIIGTDWDTVIGNVTFTITMPKEFESSKLGFSSGLKGSTDNSNVKYSVTANTITGYYNGILKKGEALTVRCELPEGYFVNAALEINPLNYLFIALPIGFLVLALLFWYFFGRDDQVIETVEFYPPQGLNSLEVGFLYKGSANNQDVTSLLIYLANKGYLAISDKNIDLKATKVKLSEEAEAKADKKITELKNKLDQEKQTDPNSKKIPYYKNLLKIYENISAPVDYPKYLFSFKNKEPNFVIKKLKEYDGTNLNEQLFMDGLFVYDRTEVTAEMLYNNFYVTSALILGDINKKENKNKIFESSSLIFSFLIKLMIVATFCLITIPPFIETGNMALLLFALVFPGIGFTTLFATLIGGKQRIYVNNKSISSSLFTIVFGLIWGLCFGGLPWLFITYPILKNDPLYLIGYGIGLACVFGMVISLKYITKRTTYGNEMLGKLRGFKNFLETAEKDKLEAMVMQDPEYFYNILPYTYVLGVSDKWIKKFESISMAAPSWYDSPNAFDLNDFGTFMDSTMSTAESVMSSSPSSSSDSSDSSGGGSSGGGSGGGGGGSW